MDILRTEGLTRQYGTGQTMVTALDHVDLQVERGQFVAIIGASGSGKSTLLHLLGGVDRPDGGKIFVEDVDIATFGEERLAQYRRRKVGLIYQFYNLIPTLSVKKNIMLPMLLDNKEPGKERFDDIVRTLGLGDRLEHLPGQLSGGQQQRAAIGRALIYQPAILLADEPTGNLDRKNTEEIISLLKLSNRQYKQTILLVTHDENVALEADRIIKIEDKNGGMLEKGEKAAVTFQNVCFSYEAGTPVIRNFTLSVPNGKKVALVGATGSRKTTIVNLLMRFYDIESGEICINGQNIRDFARESL